MVDFLENGFSLHEPVLKKASPEKGQGGVHFSFQIHYYKPYSSIQKNLISFTISFNIFEVRQEKCTGFQPYPRSYSILKILWCYFVTLGPDLPIELYGHSMVPLGLGQAILGGLKGNYIGEIDYQKKVYFMTCSNRNCIVTTLSKELSDPLSYFVAIPIPDLTARCISKG